ncbi:hypothetical protein VF21_06152 [Pseudogymnoascus sp. 05NY08]|nr:hypothetical protein VF21_06152 [Pseudogymnoascus sp. 05NY08]
MVGGASGKGNGTAEDAGTTGGEEDEYCLQRQLVLAQHRLRAQHDSQQQDCLSSLPSPILFQSGTMPWCGGQRGVGMARGGQAGLTAFGASSSADLVVGLVELVELALILPPLQPPRTQLCVHELHAEQNSSG